MVSSQITTGDSMTRGEYLDSGLTNQGRAGWLERLQESSPRHGKDHDAGARTTEPQLPSALDEERLPGRAPEPAPRQLALGERPAAA